ncbi:hypothetical protein E2C01_053769 [Portunus trituberculatus]|uniref:Uncharacterized protein n=1 Tax=Portunus trituberculatus TaxID=210409 RepID=A0A5B7GI29_PORTR|nr:hypothetical protein [Portunus trituberculatus]
MTCLELSADILASHSVHPHGGLVGEVLQAVHAQLSKILSTAKKRKEKKKKNNRCSSLEDVVFSASLKGKGSNMRCASVSPSEVMVRPPTRGLAGDTGVLPWDNASGCNLREKRWWWRVVVCSQSLVHVSVRERTTLSLGDSSMMQAFSSKQ